MIFKRRARTRLTVGRYHAERELAGRYPAEGALPAPHDEVSAEEAGREDFRRRFEDAAKLDEGDPRAKRHPIFTGASAHDVELLKTQGVEGWNRWRDENPDIVPDLRGVDFTHECWQGSAVWEMLENEEAKSRSGWVNLMSVRLDQANCADARFEGATCWHARFDGADCRDARFEGATCWRARFEGANCVGARFEGADCRYARFEGADCAHAHFEGADCWNANFDGAYCWGARFRRLNIADFKKALREEAARQFGKEKGESEKAHRRRMDAMVEEKMARLPTRFFERDGKAADLRRASFTPVVESVGAVGEAGKTALTTSSRPAILAAAVLENADCRYADFTGADMSATNVAGADLRYAVLSGANVGEIRYDPKKLAGKCRGVLAADCYGDALFRRRVMDQDFLDQTRAEIDSHRADPKSVIWSGLIGAVIGLALVYMTFNASLGAAGWGALPAALAGSPIALGLLLAPVLTGVMLNFRIGKRAVFALWGVTNYGRDFDRVIGVAALFVLIFGAAYGSMDGVHITMLREGSEAIWFYPWFVALMGFATLGVSDLAEPVTGVGALVMMLNVLSGFLTLGLLLSVLGDKFARRA